MDTLPCGARHLGGDLPSEAVEAPHVDARRACAASTGAEVADVLHWTAAPLVAIVAACAAAYATWWRRGRLRRRPAPGASRAALVGCGVLILLVALVGPLDWLGERRLMAAHMVQHILLMSVAPALLLAGLPRSPRAAGDGGPLGEVTHRTAAACLLVGVAAIWLLHTPPLLDGGLRQRALNDLQHVPLVLAGLALAWPLAGPRRLRGLPAVVYLGVGELAVGVLGVWLAWYPDVVYRTYEQLPRLWGLTAATDQAVAGAILLVAAEPLLAVEVAVLFIRALQDSDDETEQDGATAP